MLSFRSKVDAGFSVTIGVNKPYPPSREDQFTSALAKLRQWSMRWSVGWSRSLRFIPAVRPGIGGAITSDAGNRLEDSSRSLTQPVRKIRDSARERAPPQYPSRYLMIAWPSTALVIRACRQVL